jgi:hypothetical protein
MAPERHSLCFRLKNMDPNNWLKTNALGYSALKEAEREAIVHFLFLWSLFEARVLDKFASSAKILSKVHEWSARDRFDPKMFDIELLFFQKRYFLVDKPTNLFDGLNLRKSDSPKLVREVLSGTDRNPSHCVAVVLIVIYRLRNNLFHGEKWAYEIKGQLENFKHANAALITALSFEIPS